jgi:hypothetical protein
VVLVPKKNIVTHDRCPEVHQKVVYVEISSPRNVGDETLLFIRENIEESKITVGHHAMSLRRAVVEDIGSNHVDVSAVSKLE